jgi:tRNA/rRNA methyltransferase
MPNAKGLTQWLATDAARAKAKRQRNVSRRADPQGSALSRFGVFFRGVCAKRCAMTPPAIILVRPQLGENIGMVARAMWNFGLDDLRLVAPRDGWPNPAAGPPAAGADIVLEKASVFGTLAEAIADLHRVYATTVRMRSMMKEVITAREAATRIHALGGAAGLMFGPERSGLESDDVAMADAILTVPVNPLFGSLNLSQAVILAAYEWYQMQSDAPPARLEGDDHGPATHGEVDGLIAALDAALEARGYFFPEDRAPVMRRILCNILKRPGYTAQEVRSLRGIIRALDKAVE